MAEVRRSLLGDRDFVTWWSGQSVSLLGDSFTMLALPLVAAVSLHASPFQMGILGAAASVPALLFGLPAGLWLDRVRRRPVMVAAQAAEAIALASIPAAAVVGGLTVAQLYLVAFITGTGTAFLRISQNSYLPALTGRDRLVEANSLYQSSMTAAGLAGPTLAGLAVQLLTAPIAIAFDAASFVVGAASSWAVRKPEPAPAPRPRRHLAAEVGEGFGVILRQPALLAILATLVLANAGGAVTGSVFALLFVTQLGLTPFELGILGAIASAAALGGARLVGPLAARLGVGRTMAGAALLFGAGALLGTIAPLLPRALVFPFMAVSGLTFCGLMVYNVNQQALRGALTPDHLLGRANSAVYVCVVGLRVFAALLGGTIGQRYGLYAAFVAGSVMTAASAVPAFAPALLRLREVPATAPAI